MKAKTPEYQLKASRRWRSKQQAGGSHRLELFLTVSELQKLNSIAAYHGGSYIGAFRWLLENAAMPEEAIPAQGIKTPPRPAVEALQGTKLRLVASSLASVAESSETASSVQQDMPEEAIPAHGTLPVAYGEAAQGVQADGSVVCPGQVPESPPKPAKAAITAESGKPATGKGARAGEAERRVELAAQAQALRDQGLSWGKIARQWNAEGVPTLRGGTWDPATVMRLVQRSSNA